ncbi:unnamed protein product [Thlaspi arvense]|uniref:F-box domain-containing protein n=1 Tax=Thlaspi arvense TaxID=13288 RepID=A0AAU9SMG1_THLAR|nr:unnamed protein product [Thlaspi arvense]
MDKISELPDELILTVLSSLPAKDVVSTMVLSKRWKFLWMFVPKLECDYNDRRLCRFVNSLMLLHEAPVLECLRFNVSQKTGAILNIGALKRGLREVIIETDDSPSLTKTLVLLPRPCFGTTLAALRLSNVVLVDVYSSPLSFPSLKILSLGSVIYPCGEFVNRILSGCPVLQDLEVQRCEHDNVMIFVVRVPSLESLWLLTSPDKAKDDAHGFVVEAPSLKILNILDYSSGFCTIDKKMHKIVSANLDVDYSCTKKLLGRMASVQQLYLCLSTSMEAYHEGRKYSQLVWLELCTCQIEWFNLLMRLLKDSPKLRFLKLEQYHQDRTVRVMPCWSEPSYVPECLTSSLETFEWVGYDGREEEKQVARFILGNSHRLKTATFYHEATVPEEKLIELSMLRRSSSICELACKESYGQIPRYR